MLSGLGKFHFDVQVSPLKIVHVKDLWMHVRAREVFETIKLLLTRLEP